MVWSEVEVTRLHCLGCLPSLCSVCQGCIKSCRSMCLFDQGLGWATHTRSREANGRQEEVCTSNIYRGSLLHTAILSLLPFRCSLSPLLLTGTIAKCSSPLWLNLALLTLLLPGSHHTWQIAPFSHMEWLIAQTLLSGNWCPSRINIRMASVFTIHSITRLCSHIT